MLTPEQIAALRDAAGQVTDPISDFLVDDIARRIAGAGQLTGTASYQIWRAQQMGLSQKALKKRLRTLLHVSHRDLRRLLTQSAEVGYDFDIKHLPYVQAVPFAQNAVLQQMVSAAVTLAQEDFTNLTQTLGMVGPDGVAYPLQEAYRKSMDYAFQQVFTGAADYNTAIRAATKNLANRGVRVIDYASGVHTSLEAAARRNIMGGLGLMQEQISRQNHNAVGADGWEISAHAASAPDHEPIQGHQYSDSRYEALNGSLKRRIGTLNCGHAAFPIILGVSSQQYTQEELAAFRSSNAEGVDYQGKHYTLYEATQKQRQVERAIRTQKRRVLTAKATGDTALLETSQIRLRRLNDEYARFSRGVGIPTQRERAQIAGWGRSQASQASAVATAARKNAAALFPSASGEDSLKLYLKEKPVIDILSSHGIQYRQRISAKEIIVDAGAPKIARMTGHATTNLETKADRTDMTTERAQAFVDNARLTLYQRDRGNLKFLAEDGYAILNLDHALVTAVPQKWREKYDTYLGG